jgi:hypothetical protein
MRRPVNVKARTLHAKIGASHWKSDAGNAPPADGHTEHTRPTTSEGLSDIPLVPAGQYWER